LGFPRSSISSPPGSGKTKTILAIVGALLTDTLRNISGVGITRPQPVNGSGRPQASSPPSKKLLVCAPSNAAVDELVMRLKEGVKSLTGHLHKISVIRLGRTDNINANVMDVTLDELVSAKLNTAGKKSSTESDIGKTMLDHKAVSDKLNSLFEQLKELKAKGSPQTPEQSKAVEVLKRKKQQLSNEIDRLRDSGHGAARDAEISRRKVQQEILDSAHVLCATLSGSGHDMFQNLNIEFETVIIDEAAQSIELSALIPLKYGCAKCIMVGDPKQLPPTVLSREAARFQYEQSLFVRMQSNRPDDVHLLDTQYRMHPEISTFPSQAFYDGKLLDGPGMAKLRARPWHANDLLGPYRFFDVQGAHQSAPKGHSLINIAELEVALRLYDRLIMECKDYDFTGKVGIITPYKSQLAELRSRFARKYGDAIFKKIEFNTTDAFQGRESEVIIFSCVRASAGGGIGFLSDIRRMNVGITRAKSSLWVLGNSQSLRQGEYWSSLIEDAKRRKRYTQGNILEILKARTSRSMAINKVHGQAPQPVPAFGSIDQDVEMLDAYPPISYKKRKLSLEEVSPSKQNSNGASSKPRRNSNTAASGSTDQAVGTFDAYIPASYRKRKMSLEQVSPSKQTFNAASSEPRRNSKTVQSLWKGPSGGAGFDTNNMCCWCGSFKHTSMLCDNEEALKTARRCWRCQQFQHTANSCYAERCLECGEFGHLRNTCSNTNLLSNTDKQRLARLESAQKLQLVRHAESQRKRALGEHDRAVPSVKATRKTPPLEPHVPNVPGTGANNTPLNDRKRRREPSPPRGLKASKTKSCDSSRKASPATPVTSVITASKEPEDLPINDLNSSKTAPLANMMREPIVDDSDEEDGEVKETNFQQPQHALPPRPSFTVPKGTQPPQMRKKKEVDPFIRRKPPRK
jgi:senataxin